MGCCGGCQCCACWVDSVYRLKQQRLKAWKPVLTPCPVISIFLGVGIVFIALGFLFFFTTRDVYETEYVRYDNAKGCKIDEKCTVDIEVNQDMEKEVYLYYRLTKYNQNHRRYAQSRSPPQLRGDSDLEYSDLAQCVPRISEDDEEDDDAIFLPCGLIAYSLFNDEFSLSKNGKDIKLKESDIAWSTDVGEKYVTPSSGKGVKQVFGTKDYENEHFVVWMRVAALPQFNKLYGRISQKISKGKYQVEIENNYEVSDFSGEKKVFLSTTSWLGGYNLFLPISYWVVGGICLLAGTILLIITKTSASREDGDVSLIPWMTSAE